MNYLAICRYLQDNGETNVETLFSLRDDGDGIFFEKWDTAVSQPTSAQISAAQSVLDAEEAATQYQRDRQEAYPTIGDQLDALWKGGVDADAMKVIIDGVKTTYPKV